MAMEFSPDGRTLVGGLNTGQIRLWNPGSGQESGSLGRHLGLCRSLAYFDGGKKLVSGGSARSLKVWDVAGKKELATLRQDERAEDLPVPLAMAATADGSLIAVATEDKGVILRDGHSGEV